MKKKKILLIKLSAISLHECRGKRTHQKTPKLCKTAKCDFYGLQNETKHYVVAVLMHNLQCQCTYIYAYVIMKNES